jgi:hypothetical protein
MVNKVNRTGRARQYTRRTSQRPGTVKITARLNTIFIKSRAQFSSDSIYQARLDEIFHNNGTIAAKCLYDSPNIGRSFKTF